MTNARRRSGLWTMGALAGGALAAAGTDALTAPSPLPPPEELLRIRSDEPITVRFPRAVRPSLVGSESFLFVRESDGSRAGGRYVSGTFLRDAQTGVAVVVDPDAYRQAVQVVNHLDADAARAFVDKTLARAAQTGRTRDLLPLKLAMHALNDALPEGPAFDADLGAVAYAPYGLRSLPQQDASASAEARALRTLQAGDDSLWERFATGPDLSAWNDLSSDPQAARFHHSVDPLTGQLRVESDYRRRETRRLVFTGARAGRTYTFVPDVPESPQLSDASFVVNQRYDVTLASNLPNPVGGLLTGDGFRAVVRKRVAHVETTNPERNGVYGDYGATLSESDFGLSEMRGASFRVVDVTPPSGESLVDPSTDWENPDDRYSTPRAQRRPFVVRARFNAPLDPRTVSPTTFGLVQTRAGMGAADERAVSIPIPVDVRLRQSRLGTVEVEVAARIALDPASAFQFTIRNLVSRLDRKTAAGDTVTTFTTAVYPYSDQLDVFFDDFRRPNDAWREADTASPRALFAADAAHDPANVGVFVPFLPGDAKPVDAIETQWLDSGGTAPRYVVRSAGTVVHAPAGASVRIFARTAPADVSAASTQPNLFLVDPWTEVDPAHEEFLGQRFVQLRIEFTLQPGATIDTPDLPYVERIVLVGLRP